MGDIEPRIIGAIFTFIGLFCLYVFWNGYRIFFASRNWPTVTGEVLESRVKTRTDSDTGATGYRVHMLYSYEVEGQPYKCGAVTIAGDQRSGQKRAEASVAKYPVGASVSVIYNPDRPGEAFLERVLVGRGNFFIFGTIFMGLGAAILLGLLPR